MIFFYFLFNYVNIDWSKYTFFFQDLKTLFVSLIIYIKIVFFEHINTDLDDAFRPDIAFMLFLKSLPTWSIVD